MKKILLCLFTGLVLIGCQARHLSVQSQYLNRSDLASFYIDTPDPHLRFPRIGKQLLVQWCFPRSYASYCDLHLKITIRFADRSEMVETVLINALQGHYLYQVVDEEYVSRGGIRTFKVEAIGNGQVLDTWYHQLWVDLIQLPR